MVLAFERPRSNALLTGSRRWPERPRRRQSS